METTSNLRESILKHDNFFQKIVSMIPPDLYKTQESELEEEINSSKYYKHRKLPLTPNERKTISSLKKQEKYGVSEDNQQIEPENMAPTDSQSNFDDLRDRLQKRILGLKSMRMSTKSSREESDEISVKQTSDSVSKKSSKSSDLRQDLIKSTPSDDGGDDENDGQNESEEDEPEVGDIEFGIQAQRTIKASSDVGKSGSKVRRLNRMLEEIEKKKKRLNDLSSQGEAGKKRVTEEHWNDVMKHAAGEKTIEDSKKIKKALKKIDKAKQKSRKEWAERIETVEDSKKTRIDKREENINARKNKGHVPKTEDKKLSSSKAEDNKPRAGFEGKKTGKLNSNHKPKK